MKVKIETHKKGDGGILCLPLYMNVPDADKRHPDWTKANCPVCGGECWESDLHRKILKQEPGLKVSCTFCALKVGMKYDN